MRKRFSARTKAGPKARQKTKFPAAWAMLKGSELTKVASSWLSVCCPLYIAHAAGNFVFCLAFGPAFVRALNRFRTRLTIRWRPEASQPTRPEYV